MALSKETDVLLRRAFPGKRLYVPKKPTGDSWKTLVAAIGLDAAAEVVSVHGGEGLTIGMQGRGDLRRELAARWAAGESVRSLAARTWQVQLSERTIAPYLLGADGARPARKQPQPAKPALRRVA